MALVQFEESRGHGGRRGTPLTTVVVQSSSHSGRLNFQFHYRVPVAVRKQDTNCTVSTGGTACQAKWSSTGSV